MKKHTVPNLNLILIVAVGLCLAAISVYFFIGAAERDNTAFAVVFGIFALAVFVASPIIMPHYFVFTDEGVKIAYAFGKREEAKWREIESVWVGSNGRSRSYFITPMTGDKTFFTRSAIPVNFLTRRYMRHYLGRGTDGEYGMLRTFFRELSGKGEKEDKAIREAAQKRYAESHKARKKRK